MVTFPEAGQRYRLASPMFAERYGSSYWETVRMEIMVALMKATDFPGCPQSSRKIHPGIISVMAHRLTYLRNFMPLRIPTHRTVKSSEK
jgi:hypothetical protein